jgi:hypothetical protein
MFLLEGWTVNKPGWGLAAGGVLRHVVQGSSMNLLASLTNVAKQSASIFRIMCERWI